VMRAEAGEVALLLPLGLFILPHSVFYLVLSPALFHSRTTRPSKHEQLVIRQVFAQLPRGIHPRSRILASRSSFPLFCDFTQWLRHDS